MTTVFRSLFEHLRFCFKSRYEMQLENLWLRQQILVFERNKGPRLNVKQRERVLFVLLYRLLPRLRPSIKIVHPNSLLRWHKECFRKYWWRKSGRRIGHPTKPYELQALIRQIKKDNPLWGCTRIRNELLKLGFNICPQTVQKYLRGLHTPPSGQKWMTFLRNHLGETAAIDFLAVPTINFKILYVLVILEHSQRRIWRMAVTRHPTTRWTAQQVAQAFPPEYKPKYLLRDRSSSYGEAYQQTLARLNIQDLVTSPYCWWQNIYVERLIGSIRRECTDHVIALNERQLTRVVLSYQRYYNRSRPHMSLDGESPVPRPVLDPTKGRIYGRPEVGGLHHCYVRIAA